MAAQRLWNLAFEVRENEELFIRNEELFIRNEELCIKNEEFCIKNDELCSTPATSAGSGCAPRKPSD